MSLIAHIMKDQKEKEIPPFRLACKFSKEIAERINNMSPMELRRMIQNAGTERGSLQTCKPGGSMPSVDDIAKQRDMFLDFCNRRECADCPILPYKYRGERFACAIAWAQTFHAGENKCQ